MSTTKTKPDVAWPKCDDAGKTRSFTGVDTVRQSRRAFAGSMGWL